MVSEGLITMKVIKVRLTGLTEHSVKTLNNRDGTISLILRNDPGEEWSTNFAGEFIIEGEVLEFFHFCKKEGYDSFNIPIEKVRELVSKIGYADNCITIYE
jgi:hypothetical protein